MDRKQQILSLINKNGALTTNQVSVELLLDRANTSKHLNILESEGKLLKTKIGRLVYYSTDGKAPQDASDTRLNTRKKEILAYVYEKGPITTNEVAVGLGIERAYTSKNLNCLVKSGELSKIRQNREIYYSSKTLHLIDKDSKRFQENRCWHCNSLLVLEALYCHMCGSNIKRSRSRIIATEVKQIVWKRDEGKCVLCGTKENLHYDHIIPFAKGGSNTVENIQVLCATCNLRKSDRIE